MLVLPLALGLLLPAVDPSATGRTGYRPSGLLVESEDLGRLALLRDPRVRPFEFRSIGDGVRREEGWKGIVLAEVEGPGIIQCLALRPDPGAEVRLRIEADGRDAPMLDVSLADMVGGQHPHFPFPLVGRGEAGAWSFVPIAFRSGCKVFATGLGRGPFAVSGVMLPSAEGVVSFAERTSPADRARLARAAGRWAHPGREDLPGAEVARYPVEALGRSTLVFELPAGPRTIRALEVVPTAATARAWAATRLRLVWDGDEDDPPGVDLPLGLACGRVEGSAPYRSLLTGQTDDGWYNRAPMPYRRQARLRLDAPGPIRGLIRVITVPEVDPDAGYFRASVEEVDESRPLLARWGRGHLAGLLAVADGRTIPRAEAVLLDSLGRPEVHPAHGLLRNVTEGESRRIAFYRWHVADPLPFISDEFPVGLAGRVAIFWYSDHPWGPDAGS
jgi:hypothetical protein